MASGHAGVHSSAIGGRATSMVAGLLLLVGIASVSSVILVQRDYKFDDAFISFRYARNLAQGEGLRWNRGETPVEGYTNFLLVLALAPLISIGLDPLRMTQGLSVLAAVVLCWLLARLARRDYGASIAEAILAVGLFLPLGSLGFLCLLGIETVIYTTALFAAYVYVTGFLQAPSGRALGLGCLWLLAAFLLRPEAALLVAALLPTFLSPGQRAQIDHRRLRQAKYVWIVIGVLVVPITLYAGWKVIYFGDILPAPFYIKAAGARLVSASGLGSVLGYYASVKAMVVLTLLSVVLAPAAAASRRVGLVFIALYTLFYVRVDTLMDVEHRFLYPVTPFLATLGMPAVAALGRILRGVQETVWPRALAVAVALILGTHAEPLEIARNIAAAARGWSVYAQAPQSEYVLARRLAEYEDARNLSIALGDAGLVPYYTDAVVIDCGGLNDRVISRGGDVRTLVDYAFARRPTRSCIR
jgi:hypothetical protein